ncbi:hypothetical protein OEZ86_002782 [Tetradesmus obliquus]|nr:hypothetical protein OEZ86_002782 [Tetradesmus obliquus]
MERTPAAAAAAAAAAPGNSNGEVHVVPAKPAIFQDATALQIVFAKLAPRDLCALVQTCKTMRQLADTPWVWKAQAERKWGALAAPHLGGYPSHKALLLDDCRRSAVLSLPFPAQSACSYTRQRPDYFFRCKLLQLEWLRCDNSLRLWFDARGEADLRHPMSSSLAVITLSPAIQRHTTPAAAVAAGPGSAAAGAVCLNWETALAVCSPDDCQLIVSTHGHYKGVLCTTNDWRYSGLQPDYRPTLLVASPGQAAAAAAAAATQPHPGWY